MTNNSIKDAEYKKFGDNDTQKPYVRTRDTNSIDNHLNFQDIGRTLNSILCELQKLNIMIGEMSDLEIED